MADVTLQSSCHADDESVIKVSARWSFYYQLRGQRHEIKEVDCYSFEVERLKRGKGWLVDQDKGS